MFVCSIVRGGYGRFGSLDKGLPQASCPSASVGFESCEHPLVPDPKWFPQSTPHTVLVIHLRREYTAILRVIDEAFSWTGYGLTDGAMYG